nr:immunoglobulin light chain junction region [Macaca mulatta]
CHQETNWPWTF